MARKDGRPEVQHYVPEVLLKNFAVEGGGREPQIHVFDKRDKRRFLTAIGNIVAERRFYDVKQGDVIGSLEPGLAKLENHAGEAFSKIFAAKTLVGLSDDDRNWIALFVALQFARVQNFRDSILESDKATQGKIREMGFDPHDVEGYEPFENSDDAKAFSLAFLVNSAPTFAPFILTKHWILMETDESRSFWIGDNPVVMYNERQFGPYGNIGFGVPYIQIYLPLTATLTIAFFCRVLVQELRKKFEEAQVLYNELRVEAPAGALAYTDEINKFLSLFEKELPIQTEFFRAVDNGVILRSSADNVDFVNSIQARWANRYVMSSSDNFDLVERMLNEFPHSHKGMRFKVD